MKSKRAQQREPLTILTGILKAKYRNCFVKFIISRIRKRYSGKRKAIKELDDALAKHKAILAEAIRQVYEYNTLSYIEIILGYGTLSDFNQKLEEIDRLQVSLKLSMEEISKAKQQMKQRKLNVKEKEQQEQYKTMQEMSKQSLATKQQQQQYLLEN